MQCSQIKSIVLQSPTQVPPFQRHFNNSNSTTPSPAPPQQPLQQPSSVRSIAQQNSTCSNLTQHISTSSSALDLNAGASLAEIQAPSLGMIFFFEKQNGQYNFHYFPAATNTTTFDYLYEFSETRKVLEDFFKCPNTEEDKKISDCFNESDTGSFVSFSPSLRTICH